MGNKRQYYCHNCLSYFFPLSRQGKAVCPHCKEIMDAELWVEPMSPKIGGSEKRV